MAYTPDDLTDDAATFLAERHLGSLTTLRGNGLPHVVAVGFTWDPEARKARVITSEGSQKVVNVERAGHATVFQVDRARWLALEGTATVRREPEVVREAEERYAGRYRVPRENPRRVVIEITVTRILGSRSLLGK
ncbi:pyridoxamine 5'-phosphate oxidase family protein [Lolliginicoccus levis]|uniref:pyridoxamine 5'-phosphate oxidase family protein n=1 Tax=Lolliginicoccus levis TaxID=2919542 RepID=UPI00241E5B46|nr:PPOX class F420-dependent oxidoreductase [Lolliginicoccus levis]